jgi:hemerythrin-like domain-containing protein
LKKKSLQCFHFRKRKTVLERICSFSLGRDWEEIRGNWFQKKEDGSLKRKKVHQRFTKRKQEIRKRYQGREL